MYGEIVFLIVKWAILVIGVQVIAVCLDKIFGQTRRGEIMKIPKMHFFVLVICFLPSMPHIDAAEVTVGDETISIPLTL